MYCAHVSENSRILQILKPERTSEEETCQRRSGRLSFLSEILGLEIPVMLGRAHLCESPEDMGHFSAECVF